MKVVLHTFPAWLNEGRLLEAILKAERGVASRGGDSQSFAPGGSAPRLRALRPVCEELARTDPVARRSASLGGAAGEGEARRPAQNRHGGAPRGERLRETQGASQGVWRAALRHAPPVHRAPERYLGAPPPLIRVREAKKQNPGAKNAPRERRNACCLTSEYDHDRVRLSRMRGSAPA